tara:strand:- start:402 stop:767 length:366 start_codon:yes stop_codon:yes gene_type:complete
VTPVGEPNHCQPPSTTFSSSSSSSKNDRFENKKRRRDHTVAEVPLLSPKELLLLHTSEPVRKAAKSSQLQEVVRGILGARDPHKALASRLEKDPYFSSFADDVMIAVGKAERGENGQVLVL